MSAWLGFQRGWSDIVLRGVDAEGQYEILGFFVHQDDSPGRGLDGCLLGFERGGECGEAQDERCNQALTHNH
jgi:hypothetical protein